MLVSERSFAVASVRQHLSASFHRERNNQQAYPKGYRGNCNGLAESPHPGDHSSHTEVHSRGNETSERSSEGKRGGTNRGSVLLRQPKAEDSEIATKEGQEKQDREKGTKSAGQVERPAKAEQDADRHAEEVKGQTSLSANPFAVLHRATVGAYLPI